MKLVELRLAPFGPFERLSIDLSGGAGLHVVHGKNEAGKSTTLRAVTGLFYGIPHDTRDAHRFGMPKLRISGRVRLDDGSELELTRRKGVKNTLLDRQGHPIDERVLARALGGVGPELYQSMFGLDHQSLGKGAEALLRGKGDLGETLFDAGVGGAAVHAVLAELEKEADELFRPRGQTQLVNKGLKHLAELRRFARQSATDPAAWEKQTAEVETLRREVSELEARRRLLLAEKYELEQRIELERELASAQQERTRIEGSLRADQARRATLTFSEKLAALSDERREELLRQLGVHEKAARDLPKRSADLAALESEARTLLARLGRGPSLEEAERSRVDAPTLARIRKLANAHAGVARAASDAAAELSEAEARLAVRERQLSELPAAADSGELEAVLARVQRAGDLDARLADATSELGSALDRARSLAEEIVPGTDAEAVARLALPANETLDVFELELGKLQQRLERLGDDLKLLAESEARVAQEERELARAGEVPSEKLLEAERARRDESWRELRETWSTGAPSPDVVATFEAALRRADDVADRLWREADRVARAEKLAGDHAALATRRAQLERERGEGERALAELSAEWRAAWSASGLEPRTPREMRALLARHAELKSAVSSVRERQRAVRQIESTIEEHRAALSRALVALGVSVTDGNALASVVDRARLRAESERARERQRSEIEQARRELALGVAAFGAKAESRRRELASWQESWTAVVGALMGEGASPEEVTSTLDALDQLFRVLDSAASIRQRIRGMERDAEEFSREVSELVGAHAPELADLSPEQAAAALARQHEKAREAERAARDVDARIDEQQRALDALERKREELERRRTQSAGDAPEFNPRVRLLEIEEDLEKLVAELREADGRVRSAEAGLERFGQAQAVQAEQDAQTAAASVREHVQRYVRLKLAATLLGREIERYRERHQGPLVARASQLFEKLTRQSFASLRADVDANDQPVLVCVRPDGSSVSVPGLSEGTREQLYLALRLASLERYGEQNQLLPLVLDDVLIHSDDDRAGAALELLGDLGARLQILLFTHHSHLVERARAVVPEDRLFVHELGARVEAAARTVHAED